MAELAYVKKDLFKVATCQSLVFFLMAVNCLATNPACDEHFSDDMFMNWHMSRLFIVYFVLLSLVRFGEKLSNWL